MAKNPSACENAVTAPEPFPVGNAMGPPVGAYQRDQHEFFTAELGQ